MAPNPQKVRCSHAGSGGQGCRAWAMRGSDPPLCATHARAREGRRSESGRSARGAGPVGKPGSENDAVGGFYATVLRGDELADLATYAGDLSLDHEIACARVALRRVLTLLSAPLPPGSTVGAEGAPVGGSAERVELSPGEIRLSHDDRYLSPGDYARLAEVALEAIRTVAKLMRDRRALSGEAGDGFARAIAQALDELSTEWGISL